MLQEILHIVRDAGAIAHRHFGHLAKSDIEFKSAADLVTPIDREVEAFLRQRLLALMPDAGFVGEESGSSVTDAAVGRHFVVDPIDGTNNYVHGIPFYSISLALKENGRTILGVVHLPEPGTTYHAELGKGAWKDGQVRLQASNTSRLIHALASTGFACIRQRLETDSLVIFNAAVHEVRDIRRFGSAAIDLCMVAEGTVDLYWESNIKPWDIAAGTLILEEAGGRVTDLDGGPDQESRQQIVASNGPLHPAFLELVRRVRPDLTVS
jgi:myo-inositol-1(or 4)-monophosphatase